MEEDERKSGLLEFGAPIVDKSAYYICYLSALVIASLPRLYLSQAAQASTYVRTNASSPRHQTAPSAGRSIASPSYCFPPSSAPRLPLP